jgi:WhiB family redox-sensing transcriptional regulator
LSVVVHEQWQLKAACRGPKANVFFPPSLGEQREERAIREAEAKAICATCVVRQRCLAYALELHEVHGIWGGLTELERKALLEEASKGNRAATPKANCQPS